MGIHQEQVHPAFREGCAACRWSTVAVAPSATPSRKGGAEAARVNAKEKEWARDMRAYKTLVGQGLDPRQIDGCHRLEGATDRFEVEAGHVLKTKAQRDSAREGIERAEQFKADIA